MLYFFDTEFLEDGVTVEPISIGICAEDGRELYLEFKYDENRVNESEFLGNNVVPHLTETEKLSRSEVAERVLEFIGNDEEPQFWAWYAAYDWIVMCQLFGRMIDLPKHFPKFVRDLRQTCAEKGLSRSSLPKTPENAHNALADARWVKAAYSVAVRFNQIAQRGH